MLHIESTLSNLDQSFVDFYNFALGGSVKVIPKITAQILQFTFLITLKLLYSFVMMLHIC